MFPAAALNHPEALLRPQIFQAVGGKQKRSVKRTQTDKLWSLGAEYILKQTSYLPQSPAPGGAFSAGRFPNKQKPVTPQLSLSGNHPRTKGLLASSSQGNLAKTNRLHEKNKQTQTNPNKQTDQTNQTKQTEGSQTNQRLPPRQPQAH